MEETNSLARGGPSKLNLSLEDGLYNAEASTRPSRLNALRIAVGRSNLSKEEPKYSPAGLAHKEK